MRAVIRMRKSRALAGLLVLSSAISFFLGFAARAEESTETVSRFQVGDSLSVETGLEDGFESLDFSCLDTDYAGGILFLSDQVIPYELCSRYAASTNDYTDSDIRTWLNQYFADSLSVTEELMPVKLEETSDSVSDRVFCLSLDEVKNTEYRAFTKENWMPERGNRYYWTRTKRENTENQAYMVQYNGHIASSRVSLTQAGVRPAFVLKKAEKDTDQEKIWYPGDIQEREIDGKSYTFSCIDPDYRDAGGNRVGALFLCDSIIGNESSFDETLNAWEVSDLRRWLSQALSDSEGMAETVTTCPFTYAGKSRDYLLSEKKFTKRARSGKETKDNLFSLSLEDAIRYQDVLWKLNGAKENNFTVAGTYQMGYWLRTPAGGDGTKCYAVTYDGRVAPEVVNNEKMGIRPAYVAVQK